MLNQGLNTIQADVKHRVSPLLTATFPLLNEDALFYISYFLASADILRLKRAHYVTKLVKFTTNYNRLKRVLSHLSTNANIRTDFLLALSFKKLVVFINSYVQWETIKSAVSKDLLPKFLSALIFSKRVELPQYFEQFDLILNWLYAQDPDFYSLFISEFAALFVTAEQLHSIRYRIGLSGRIVSTLYDSIPTQQLAELSTDLPRLKLILEIMHRKKTRDFNCDSNS